ncbi:MAG: twin-arginine translocase TatA/TatE family subunit [Coriobacteriales bacterium]
MIFGPKNLPKLGSAIGKTVKNVRDGMNGKDEKVEGSNEDGAEVAESSDDSKE